jgi:transcriptional regulator with XRE-family HTH domain
MPAAIIHKKILDTAAANPDASLEEISEEVNGATVPFVDKVLDDYGDPAQEGGESATHQQEDERSKTPSMGSESQVSSDATDTGEETTEEEPEPADEMSDQQRKILRRILENPDASQSELAQAFEVSRATISRRLNSIPGFDWGSRHRFAREALDETDSQRIQVHAVEESELERVCERIDSLEQRLASLEGDRRQVSLPPESIHKVAHACMESEQFSTEEELQLLKRLIEAD